jgi:hypothetical protein
MQLPDENMFLILLSLSRARFQLYVLLCCRISENNDLAHSARSGRVIS